MGILRAGPVKVQAWAPRSAALSWRTYDFQLTICAFLLTCFGLAMAYSNSVDAAHPVPTLNSPFARGLLWAAIATGAFIAATAFDYKWLHSFAWPLYLANLALLLLTLAIGTGVGDATGAARWIVLGPLQLQFSELAKIIMVIVMADYLARRQKRIDSIWTIVGAGLVIAPPWVLVMLQPDLGTSLVFMALTVGMLFVAGASLVWLGTMAAAAAASVPIVWSQLREYQQARILAFIHPGTDPQGAGYQLTQAQQAVSAGGFWGKGLTNGSSALPVQTTDFVWGVLAEELGFVGSIVVLALFAVLLWRLVLCSWRSTDPLAMLVAAGLASIILFQVVVNVGMVVGLMPVTGIPLPFVTHGGASLVSLGIGLGVLQSMNLRRHQLEW
jgi:rod shape determining protein RodA